MSAPDLTAMLAVADLSSEAERLILSDAYDDAGLIAEAEALRGEHAHRMAYPPDQADEVAQTTGYTVPDDFGHTMNYERRLTVRTEHDGDAGSWDALPPSERLWWIVTIDELHAARVRLAGASPEVREHVAQNMTYGDLADEAALINALIDEAE